MCASAAASDAFRSVFIWKRSLTGAEFAGHGLSPAATFQGKFEPNKTLFPDKTRQGIDFPITSVKQL